MYGIRETAELQWGDHLKMTKQDFIFSLIRSALWQKPYPHFDMTPSEYKAVIEEAEKQSVQGLVIDCLRSNNMGLQKKCVIHMMKVYNALVAENRRLCENVAKLGAILSEEGMEYVVMKGQTLAQLYPKPELRAPGDIDFLIKDYKQAQNVLREKWDVHLPDSLLEKEVSFEYGGDTFELHTKFIVFRYGKHRKRWEELVERPTTTIQISNQTIHILEPTINVVYVFAHLFFHFIREGIGVRHLCDLSICLDRYKDVIDKKELQTILESLGMYKAFRCFGWILVEKLGLSSFPYEISEKEKKIGKQILQDVWRGGNFGNHKRKHHDSKLLYKYETMTFTVRNCMKYFWISPKELSCDIPRLIWHNLKILLFARNNQLSA